MAFQYALTIPAGCICRWLEKLVGDLPADIRAEAFDGLLDDAEAVQARISNAAGCPVHEPVRPMRVEQCGAPQCGRDIIWAKSGKTMRWMPIDAEPSVDGNITLRWMPGSQDPQATVLTVAQERERQLLQGKLHTSHFATCPDAERFRRPR